MKQQDIEKALISLDLLHSDLWTVAAEEPTLSNKARVILTEAIMRDLGYNITTKFTLVQNDNFKN
jgi:hypothetical protein